MGKAPTHNLCVKEKDGKFFKTVGVAWANHEKGSFMVKLNPGTALAWNDGLAIYLFTKNKRQQGEPVPNQRGFAEEVWETEF